MYIKLRGKNSRAGFSHPGHGRRSCQWLPGIMVILCLSFQPLTLMAQTRGAAQRITLSLKQAKLFAVFREIKRQSGYDFIFQADILNKLQPVDIQVKNVSLKEALDKCLQNLPLEYTIENKNVIITARPQQHTPASSQQRSVHGQVTDEAGNALPGANVVIRPLNRHALTDEQGMFSFTTAGTEDTVVVSYVGYRAAVLPVKNQQRIAITLHTSTGALNEVTVIGYSTQKSADITTAISSFKPDEKSYRPVLGADQMIQGKMPGVMVAGGSGNPGGANRVSIRGIGSLSANNEPLYVVDGVPLKMNNAALFNMGEDMSPLAEFNPNDIESVTVLKDAASAAIYGSRATNGVVLITTKSGRKGNAKVNVNAYTGIANVPRLHQLKMEGSGAYVEVINEAIDNYNLQYGYAPGDGGFASYIRNPYPGLGDTDWMGTVLNKNALTKSASMSLSGGTDKGTYFISGSYLDQEGNINTNRLRKYTGTVNLTHQLFPWLKVGANTNFSFSRNNRIPGSNLGSTPMARSLEQRPFDRPYKPDGSYYVGGTSELLRNNAVQILNEEKVQLDNYRFLGNYNADIQIAKGLDFKTTLGADIAYTHDYVYYNQNHPYGLGTGRLTDQTRLTSNILFENTLNYHHDFGKLNVSMLGGHSFQKFVQNDNLTDGSGFPSPSFDVNSVAAVILAASTGLSENAIESYFSRAILNFDDKYLFSASIRADGSSRFSPSKRYGYFPSLSAGWDVSHENFWQMPSTSLKLRASYGVTGNQDGIGNYAYQALTGGGYNYNEASGLAVTNPGNPNLTWEQANQFDAGVDIGLNDRHINLTADYFIKRTNNLLYNLPTMATSGFTSITSNIGVMKNWGYEFSINANYTFGDLAWNSDFNISFIKNRLISLIGKDPVLIGDNKVLMEGQEVGSFYVYKQLGIYQDDKDVPESLYSTGVRAGDIIYQDVDGNGVIDVNDRQVVGTANPDFFGGWNNSFTYKNFDFNFSFTYSSGAEVYASWKAVVTRLGSNLFPNLESEVNKRWTGPGTSNTVPRAIYGNTYNNSNSTRFLEDGSYIRLRNISLGYTLPGMLMKQWGMQHLRIYAQADNLFLLTKYSGLDPEVNSNTDPKFLGNDNLILPQPRTVIFGLNLTF